MVEIPQELLKTSKKLKAKGPQVHTSNMYIIYSPHVSIYSISF